MPRKGISYDQVAKACTDLEKSQRLSVRAIQARTGGSMTTVLKHYRRWQRERSGQQGVEVTISDRLRHALLSELEEAATQTRQSVQQEFQEVQMDIIKVKKEADSRQRRLSEQLHQAQQQNSLLLRKTRDAEQRATMTERKLRVAQARLNQQKKSLLVEQNRRRSSEAALEQIHDRKLASGNRPSEQERQTRTMEKPLQDSLQPKKTEVTKKRGKKIQQSLFDF